MEQQAEIWLDLVKSGLDQFPPSSSPVTNQLETTQDALNLREFVRIWTGPYNLAGQGKTLGPLRLLWLHFRVDDVE